MLLWIRHYVAEVCALPSAVLVEYAPILKVRMALRGNLRKYFSKSSNPSLRMQDSTGPLNFHVQDCMCMFMNFISA